MLTKEEWLDWKANPVTSAFYEACITRVEEATEILVATAGQDPVLDNFYRGFIQAYREIQEFKIEDLDES
jgi:hypothetical protein